MCAPTIELVVVLDAENPVTSWGVLTEEILRSGSSDDEAGYTVSGQHDAEAAGVEVKDARIRTTRQWVMNDHKGAFKTLKPVAGLYENIT